MGLSRKMGLKAFSSAAGRYYNKGTYLGLKFGPVSPFGGTIEVKRGTYNCR